MATIKQDDLYHGMIDEDEASPSMEGEHDESMHKGKDEEGETALLPKSFFEGQSLKPGAQYYVEIVRAYDDDVEVRYPHKIKGEEGDEEDSANSKLEAMGTEMGEGNPGPSGGGY